MIDCVVIGGGQAGLAASYHLRRRGIEHVVFERGRVAETWRTARWDGFHLNTPNWATQLPGLERLRGRRGWLRVAARGDRPPGGLLRPDRCAAADGSECRGIARRRGMFELDIAGDQVQARSLVVATGAFQQPTSHQRLEAAPDSMLQLHTSAYRNPMSYPTGACWWWEAASRGVRFRRNCLTLAAGCISRSDDALGLRGVIAVVT